MVEAKSVQVKGPYKSLTETDRVVGGVEEGKKGSPKNGTKLPFVPDPNRV